MKKDCNNCKYSHIKPFETPCKYAIGNDCLYFEEINTCKEEYSKEIYKLSVENFNKELDKTLKLITNTLGGKAVEYVRGEDRLWNFNEVARMENITPEEALHGMFLKHYQSYKDIISDIVEGKKIADSLVDEKVGDMLCYLVLFKCMVKNRNRYENK